MLPQTLLQWPFRAAQVVPRVPERPVQVQQVHYGHNVISNALRPAAQPAQQPHATSATLHPPEGWLRGCVAHGAESVTALSRMGLVNARLGSGLRGDPVRLHVRVGLPNVRPQVARQRRPRPAHRTYP